MTTENALAYANEWGTSWDDEIRQVQQEWIAMVRKSSEAQKEKLDLESRMLHLMMRARNEGWYLTGAKILYGRSFVPQKNPCRLSI